MINVGFAIIVIGTRLPAIVWKWCDTLSEAIGRAEYWPTPRYSGPMITPLFNTGILISQLGGVLLAGVLAAYLFANFNIAKRYEKIQITSFLPGYIIAIFVVIGILYLQFANITFYVFRTLRGMLVLMFELSMLPVLIVILITLTIGVVLITRRGA
jgi:hypothetical protein